MKKYLTFKDDKSDKFWSIDVTGTSFTVTYGRTGTEGQTSSKEFETEEDCMREAEKLVMETTNEGYQWALNLPYFQAGFDDVACLSDKEEVCSTCGQKDYCIDLSKFVYIGNTYFYPYHLTHTSQKEMSVSETSPGIYGCIECLRAGKFLLLHCLEGSKLLLENRIWFRAPYGTRESYPAKWSEFDRFVKEVEGIPLENLEELKKTPVIRVWQTEDWLIHCKDFMQFVGVWRKDDFTRNANEVGVTPSQLFDEICADWADEYENFIINPDAGEIVYIFKCRHCQILRANIDCA